MVIDFKALVFHGSLKDVLGTPAIGCPFVCLDAGLAAVNIDDIVIRLGDISHSALHMVPIRYAKHLLHEVVIYFVWYPTCTHADVNLAYRDVPGLHFLQCIDIALIR